MSKNTMLVFSTSNNIEENPSKSCKVAIFDIAQWIVDCVEITLRK